MSPFIVDPFTGLEYINLPKWYRDRLGSGADTQAGSLELAIRRAEREQQEQDEQDDTKGAA